MRTSVSAGWWFSFGLQSPDLDITAHLKKSVIFGSLLRRRMDKNTFTLELKDSRCPEKCLNLRYSPNTTLRHLNSACGVRLFTPDQTITLVWSCAVALRDTQTHSTVHYEGIHLCLNCDCSYLFQGDRNTTLLNSTMKNLHEGKHKTAVFDFRQWNVPTGLNNLVHWLL